MGTVDRELDRIRGAKAAANLTGQLERRSEEHQAVGAPPPLRIGARVVDPVTGEEGEIVGYTRTVIRTPPA